MRGKDLGKGEAHLLFVVDNQDREGHRRNDSAGIGATARERGVPGLVSPLSTAFSCCHVDIDGEDEHEAPDDVLPEGCDVHDASVMS